MIKKFKNNPLLINIASLGSATLLTAALSFVLGILTRNILGPEKYGYFLTVSLIFTFTPIFQLGILNAMNREVPFYLARNDLNRVQQIRETAFSFIFTIPLLLVMLLFVSSGALFLTDIKMEYIIGLLIASLIAGFTYLTDYAEMYYKSAQNFKRASKLISIKSITQSLLTILLVYFFGYIGLYLGMLLSLLIECFVAKSIFPKLKISFKFGEYGSLIKTGFPILLVGLVWSIMIGTDRMIISIAMTPKDLGNYGVGMMVFNTVMLFPQVLSQVFYPKVVQLVSNGDFFEIKKFYWKVNKWLAIIMLIIVIIGYYLLPYFITWVMPKYIQGITVGQILIIGVYPLTLVNLAANYFNSTNNQKTYLFIQIVSILLNVLLCISFLHVNKSINAVALATSISFTFYSIIMNVVFLLKINQPAIQNVQMKES